MPDKDMKKIILAFGFAVMGMMAGAYAQNSSDAPAVAPVEYASVDTVEFISDKVQNWILGASVGGSYSMSENTRFGNFFDMTRPSFQIQLGKYFYPQFGIRATVNYLAQRGRSYWETADFLEEYAEQDGNYDFSILAGFVDGVLDFHNVIFGYKEDRFFSLKGYIGLGAIYTFGFDKDKLNWLVNPTWKDCTYNGVHHNAGELLPSGYQYRADGDSKWYFAGHVGLIADFRISDAWSVNLDISFNGTDDAYNGARYRRVYDSYVDLMAGLTYRIKDSSSNRAIRYARYTDQDIVNSINNQLKETNDSLLEALKPVVRTHENVSYNEMLQTTVSFYIDKTFVTDAQKRNVRSVAKFMEVHPDLDIVITGYADKQTAYPKYNMMLSQKRAQAVYDLLVNEYGVDANRLSMDYKGDEDQPFAIVNEWNRAVVFYIKAHDSNFKPSIEDKADKIQLNREETSRLNQTDSKKPRAAY